MKLNTDMSFPELSEEVETKLAVIGPQPRSLPERIRRIRELGRFRLVPLERRLIEDRYFDTRGRALSQRGLALRIRSLGGIDRITLKFPGTWDEDGLTKRGEIEVPWSADAWNGVRNRIGEAGVALDDCPPEFIAGASLAFEAVGLTIIQRRETLRDSLSIVNSTQTNADEMNDALCLDETAHYCKGLVARRFEVEIETLRGSADLGREFAGLLRRMFPGELIPWPYGKLATGMALDALLGMECAPTVLSGEYVTDEGHRLLKERLEFGDTDHGTKQCLNTPSAT